MSIIPQKRPAEETESVKRFRKTEPNPPEKSDPIGDCIGEGIRESSTDDDDDDIFGDEEDIQMSCYDTDPDDSDPDKPQETVYCFICQGTGHVPGLCHKLPGFDLCAAEYDELHNTQDSCNDNNGLS